MTSKTANAQTQPFCFNFSSLALCLSGSMDLTTAYPHAAHCQATQATPQTKACQRAAILLTHTVRLEVRGQYYVL